MTSPGSQGRSQVLLRYGLSLGLACDTVAACASPDDPFTTGDGYASVQGQVTLSSGVPLASTTVFVVCAGGFPAVAATTDVSGRYLVGLSAGASSLNITGGRLHCRFTEPDASTPRAQRDTVLGFTRGPALAPLQTVDLRE